MTNDYMTSNNMHDDAVNSVYTEILADSKLHPEIETGKEKGYDIKVNINGKKQPIYLCVVKNNVSTQSPYSAVNATKWAFASNNPANYYFVIAFQQEDKSYINTYYTVSEFWKMTSKPKFALYCHRNRAKVHKPLIELASKHPILQDQNELNRINNSISKLIAFKESYEL